MAITTGNISRVSDGLKALTALRQISANTLRVFNEQQRIASGKQLLSVSEDPVAAEKIARMHQALGDQSQILTNLRHADGHLSAADSALTDIGDLLSDAARIASEQASSLQSEEERGSQVAILDAIISQLTNLGNRQYQGRYLFGGRGVESAPFVAGAGRVTDGGDFQQRSTRVDDGFTLPYTVSAADIFKLRDNVVGGTAVFDVQLSADARLADLGGATAQGVNLGRISATESGLGITFEVDFQGAETVDDLMARFNDAAANAGSSLSLQINPADGDSLQIVSGLGNGISVAEVGSGSTAGSLGIRQTVGAGLSLDGEDLARRAALQTRLADLNPGGVALPDGVVVTSGDVSRTITFAGATSLQEVLSALNQAGVGIRASINEAGDGIEVRNLVAGTPLVIGENGGVDAASLGIRTISDATALSAVNGRLGLHPVDGDDFRITDSAGVSFEVDVNGAQTVGDVLAAINSAAAAAGSSIVAETSSSGAGIRLTGAAGAGSITVEKVNLSAVAEELGILGAGSDTLLDGVGISASYQSGAFSALYRLRDALASNNTIEITAAGAEINGLQKEEAAIAGQVGSRAAAVRARLEQTTDAVAATTVLLSGIEDVDFVEAITKFQQAQTALQASLVSRSQALNLSLLDFLA